MRDIILVGILIILLLFFFRRHPVYEYLENQCPKCPVDSTNMLAQYNILDNKISTNTGKIDSNSKDISSLKNTINTLRISMAKKQAAIDKINSSLQEFEQAAQTVTANTSS